MAIGMQKCRAQIALLGMGVLAVASLAAAQGTLQVPSGTPQPAMRFGNFIEIGNDVLMHIIATGDFRYNTTTNWDFESKVRDRVSSRNPMSTIEQSGESDVFWMLSRFGVDCRYQKSTEVQIVLEQRTNLDGNTADDRFNSNNPGSTDIFGRAASTENKGFSCRYCWLDYRFQGTPLRLRVGFDLWQLDRSSRAGAGPGAGQPYARACQGRQCGRDRPGGVDGNPGARPRLRYLRRQCGGLCRGGFGHGAAVSDVSVGLRGWRSNGPQAAWL